MGMTMTQKILAKHAGLDRVEVGQLIEAKVDMVLGNDITTPVAITEFEKAGFTQVFDKDKIAIVLDHYTPCKDIKSAELCLQARTLRPQAQHHQLLRCGPDGGGARPPARKGPVRPRGDHRGGRLPHLHLRGGGGLLHRHRLHRHGRPPWPPACCGSRCPPPSR